MWFHDIAPRGRDNVAASDDIARCAHDIVRQLTILRCGRMISCNRSISRLAHDNAHTHDIVSAARYRTPVPILRAGSRYRTGTISCAHQRYRAIPAISCPAPACSDNAYIYIVLYRGGYCNASGPLGIDLPWHRARLRPPLGRAGGLPLRGGFAPASHEAVRLSGAVGEGPLRTPAYLRGRGVTFLTVGAALRVGFRAPSSRRGAG